MKFSQDTLYVTDLDGTLLGEEPRIPEEAVEMLNEMLDAGLPFTVATARSWASTKKIVKGLHLKHPIVLYNGAHLLDPVTGELMENCSLTRKQMLEVAALCAEAGVCCRVESMIDGICRVSWLRSMEDEGLRLYVEPRKGDARFRPVDRMEQLADGEPFQCAMFGKEEQLTPLFEQLKALDYLYASMVEDSYDKGWLWLSCARKDSNKAEGVSKLRKLTGFARIVCFGDNHNDLPMFGVADEAYAVGNAVPEAKAAATGVIGSNVELGVARFLRTRAEA